MMINKILILLVLLVLPACKEGKASLLSNKLDLGNALSEAGITGVDLRNSSSTVTTTLLPINISSPSISAVVKVLENFDSSLVNISSPSITTNVKVLENYDSPFVNIEKQDFTLYKSIPKNAKITKIYKKWKNGHLISEDTEITEPKTLQETVVKASNLPSWIATTLLILTYIGGVIIFIYKKLFKK